MAGLEHTSAWPQIVDQMASRPLKAIARTHGTTPGAIAAAWERAGAQISAVFGPTDDLPPEAGDDLPPEPDEAPVVVAAPEPSAPAAAPSMAAWRVNLGKSHGVTTVVASDLVELIEKLRAAGVDRLVEGMTRVGELEL